LQVTKALPFTEASLARAIKGVLRAGLFVLKVAPDGSLLVGDKPFDAASLVPDDEQPSLAAPKRLEDYFNGGQGEA
jgi:hypothetical protein